MLIKKTIEIDDIMYSKEQYIEEKDIYYMSFNEGKCELHYMVADRYQSMVSFEFTDEMYEKLLKKLEVLRREEA